MNLRQRIDLLGRLGTYMQSTESEWLQTKERAYIRNRWFLPPFIDLAVDNIVTAFLQPDLLEAWASPSAGTPRNIGVVMAGNIPLVGFHDFLCAFISGHRQTIKLSSKDDVLLPHLAGKLRDWGATGIDFADMLKGCDAYIATGSNNSARYFQHYFGKYPSVIRRNRTSVAVLNGRESPDELHRLADDVQLYFGLGCRNVTKLYVPQGYNFVPLLDALRRYAYFFEHDKYRNNYDYQLAIYLMNNRFYMTNDSIVLLENSDLFSPIGTLYYDYGAFSPSDDMQCIVGQEYIPFGQTQRPRLTDYADGVDTLAFLNTL